MGELYLLTFPNGKRYIGITSKTATRRRIVHLHHARKGRSGALQSAIRKYGSFEMLTLMVASDWSYLCEIERRAIVAFGTRAPLGYNMTDGGEGVVGVVRTEEQRRRASESRKGKPGVSRPGWKHTEDAKAKIAAAGIGRKFSPESRAKIGVTKIGNKYGAVPCSDEKRAKISSAQKGRPLSPEHRRNLLGKNKGKPWSAARRAAQENRANG